MKILYAIQGTGNGHIARALDVIPAIQKRGEVDILVSGIQADIQLPFEVKYRFRGMGFVFGKKGGVDIWRTYKENNIKSIYQEIKSLPIQDYDLVINDFEPISAWASLLKRTPCIALSHQSAVLAKGAPRPEKSDWIGKTILKYYAPSINQYGFHFKPFNDNTYTPVIRQQVRAAKAQNFGHYTVYLPAYNDKRIIKHLRNFPDVRWQVFSKHNKEEIKIGKITIKPINNEAFIESMASSCGVLCGAGFETPAEALFLGKKLMVIPMKQQYEQQCNAAALKSIGIPVIKSLKAKHLQYIRNWIDQGEAVQVDYPDHTQQIVNQLIDTYTQTQEVESWDTIRLSRYSVS